MDDYPKNLLSVNGFTDSKHLMEHMGFCIVHSNLDYHPIHSAHQFIRLSYQFDIDVRETFDGIKYSDESTRKIKYYSKQHGDILHRLTSIMYPDVNFRWKGDENFGNIIIELNQYDYMCLCYMYNLITNEYDQCNDDFEYFMKYYRLIDESDE